MGGEIPSRDQPQRHNAGAAAGRGMLHQPANQNGGDRDTPAGVLYSEGDDPDRIEAASVQDRHLTITIPSDPPPGVW